MGVRNNFVTLLQIDLYNNRENSKAETKQEKKSTNKKRRKTKKTKHENMRKSIFSCIEVKISFLVLPLQERLTEAALTFGLEYDRLITQLSLE